jgi:Cu(I)/Ag(I) efflux system membrane fusion protein
MSKRRGVAAWRVIVVVLAVLLVAGGGFGVVRMLSKRPAAETAKAGQLWTCPMHPSVIRSEPGQCPICGMDLVPLEEKADKETGIEGHGVVEVDPERQQLIGVKTTPVERRRLERIIRTTGRVTVDEARLSEVYAKVNGWIERLYANETGKVVRTGQPLLTIYSPELVSTQREYLLALRSRERLSKSPFPEVRKSGETLLEATRERLRLWDIPQKDIEQLEQSGTVRKALTLYSPATGYIMEKHAVEGMRVNPGMALYELADLSRVWVEADLYEYEAPLVRVGQAAKLTFASYPGQVFGARVAYVYPTVESATRAVKARLEMPNPGLKLKPEMYGDVEIGVPSGDELAVPEEAVLDTGTRQIVFVADGQGKFRPREVTLGPQAAGYYPVLVGLAEGEQVVSSPNFLIDSESRFEAAKEAITTHEDAGHAGHGP